MDLSLQAIDFLFASSIQDGWLLSGDDDGDEDDATFFRSHFSSRGLSGTLVGLDSEIKTMLLHMDILNTKVSISVVVINVIQHTCKFDPWSSLWFYVFA